MPRWDYECPKCGDQIIDSTNKREFCLVCHSEPMNRMPAAPNFAVKGFNEKNGYGSR